MRSLFHPLPLSLLLHPCPIILFDMRAALISAALLTGFVSATGCSAPEAARFGSIAVSPSSNLTVGQEITVTYNSTCAYWQPEFVDVYIQGSYPSGYILPLILIARNNYGPTQNILQFNTTVPDVSDLGDVAGWGIWAYVTYPESGLNLYGGVSGNFGTISY